MANYSIRADGTAANKAAAVDGDKTLIAECMNLTVHNAETFAAGDNIYVWSNGGAYDRVELSPPSDGSSGNNVTYEFDSSVLLRPPVMSGWNQAYNEISLAASATTGASTGVHKTTTAGYEKGNELLMSSDVSITSVVMSVARSNNPSGSVWLQIYDESGGEPNSAVANGKSDEITASSITTSFNPLTFTFSTHPSLTNGDTYFFIVESDITVDGTNYVSIEIGGSAPIDGLTQWRMTQAGTWSELTDVAVMEIFEEGSAITNVWRTSEASTVSDLHHDGTQGTKETSEGNLNTAGEWYWASGVLSFYSTSDPDTAYTSPGVEASVTDRPINCLARSYITFNGNGTEIRFSVKDGIYIKGDQLTTGIEINDFKIHDTMYGFAGANYGIRCQNVTDLTIRRVEVYKSGWNGMSLGALFDTAQSLADYLIEECESHDNWHNGIDCAANPTGASVTGAVFRYCETYGNTNGIYIRNESSTSGVINEAEVYGCVCYDNSKVGISLDSYAGGVAHEDCVIYNNTCYGNGNDPVAAVGGGGIAAVVVNSVVRNNICSENNVTDDQDYEIQINDAGGTANVMDYNCVYHSTHTNIYRWDGSNYTAANIYSSTGQQQHAVHADPKFTNAGADDFTLASDSPCIGAGDDSLGSPYNMALDPNSTWPDGVLTVDQDDY